MFNNQSILKSRGQKTFFLFILTFLILLPTACGQAPAATPTQPANLTGQIVFVSNKNGNDDIYSMDINGQNLKQLTTNGFDDYAPKWSPDGKKIVFISDRNAKISAVYTMNADGSNQTRLNTNPKDIPASPEWLPDGRQIVFATNTQHLFVLNLDTGIQTELGSYIDALSLSWSPDGKQLAFVYFSNMNLIINGIGIINSDGTGEIELKGHGTRGFPSGVSWSPDGTKIAFGKIRIQYKKGIDLGLFRQIAENTGIDRVLSKITDNTTYTPITFTMRPDGSHMHQITDQCAGGQWSPDSKWIICDSRLNANNNSLELYIVNIANSSLFRLTDTPYNETSPDWAP